MPQDSLFDRVRRAQASADPEAPVAKISAGAGDPPLPPEVYAPADPTGWDAPDDEDDGTITIGGRKLTPLPGTVPSKKLDAPVDLVKNLPAAGGAVGGMLAPAPGISSVLAGLLGGLGQGIKGAVEPIKKLNEIGWVGPMGSEGVGGAMAQAGKDIGTQAVAQGATNYAGARAAPYVAAGLQGAARKGMESAMKIDTGFLRKAAGATRGGIDPIRHEIIDDLLRADVGNPMAPGAAGRLQGYNQGLQTEYNTAIRNAPAGPIPGEAAAVQRQMQRELRRARQGTNPQDDVAQVQRFIEQANTNPATTRVIPGTPARTVQTGIAPNGQPIMQHIPATPDRIVPRDLTAVETQTVGAADNARMKDLFAGRTKNAEANALKGVMATRKGVRDRFAGTAGVTDRMRRGINMEKVAEAARKRTAATYPFSLTDVGAATASAAIGNPLPLLVTTMMKPRPLAAGARALHRTAEGVVDPNEIQRLLRRLLAGKATQEAVNVGAPEPGDNEEW